MFLDYIPGHTLLHRFDVRTKCIAFFTITLLAFMFNNPMYNLVLACLCFLIAIIIKMPLETISRMLMPLIPIFIIMFVVTGISYPVSKFSTSIAQQELFYLLPNGKLPITSGGILYGLTFIFRILVMVIASTILTYTTPIDDFLELMQKLRLPSDLAFVVATGIRFIPTLEKKSQQVLTAQKARGAHEHSGGIINRIKSYIPIMIPLIVDSIRMSENLAIAMQNRCFGIFKKRTSLNELKMQPLDYVFSCCFIAIAVVGIYLRNKKWGIL